MIWKPPLLFSTPNNIYQRNRVWWYRHTTLLPGKQEDQGHPWLHGKFKACLGLKLCLRKQTSSYEDDPVSKVLPQNMRTRVQTSRTQVKSEWVWQPACSLAVRQAEGDAQNKVISRLAQLASSEFNTQSGKQLRKTPRVNLWLTHVHASVHTNMHTHHPHINRHILSNNQSILCTSLKLIKRNVFFKAKREHQQQNQMHKPRAFFDLALGGTSLFCCCFKIGPHYVLLGVLELSLSLAENEFEILILLPPLSECWDHR